MFRAMGIRSGKENVTRRREDATREKKKKKCLTESTELAEDKTIKEIGGSDAVFVCVQYV